MIKLSEELEEVLEEAMEHFYLCWNRGIKEYLAPAVSNGRLALAIHAALDEIRLLRGERQDKRGDDGISMTEHALRDRVANAIDAGFQRTHFTVLVADAVLDIDEIREALKARASSVALERERKVSKTPIKYGAPAPDDSYAPAPAGCACVDETGRMRIMHSYVVSARDGMRCLWCNKLEPVKAAASYRGKKS